MWNETDEKCFGDFTESNWTIRWTNATIRCEMRLAVGEMCNTFTYSDITWVSLHLYFDSFSFRKNDRMWKLLQHLFVFPFLWKFPIYPDTLFAEEWVCTRCCVELFLFICLINDFLIDNVDGFKSQYQMLWGGISSWLAVASLLAWGWGQG